MWLAAGLYRYRPRAVEDRSGISARHYSGSSRRSFDQQGYPGGSHAKQQGEANNLYGLLKPLAKQNLAILMNDNRESFRYKASVILVL